MAGANLLKPAHAKLDAGLAADCFSAKKDLLVQLLGNRFSAFLNRSTNATSVLVESNSFYCFGQVGRYDYSEQTFDNFAALGGGAVAVGESGPGFKNFRRGTAPELCVK